MSYLWIHIFIVLYDRMKHNNNNFNYLKSEIRYRVDFEGGIFESLRLISV